MSIFLLKKNRNGENQRIEHQTVNIEFHGKVYRKKEILFETFINRSQAWSDLIAGYPSIKDRFETTEFVTELGNPFRIYMILNLG